MSDEQLSRCFVRECVMTPGAQLMSRTRPLVARPWTGRLPYFLPGRLANTSIVSFCYQSPLRFSPELTICNDSVLIRIIISKLHSVSAYSWYVSFTSCAVIPIDVVQIHSIFDVVSDVTSPRIINFMIAIWTTSCSAHSIGTFSVI
jgi:hypothetical protein